LFFLSDNDGNGFIDSDEYDKMISNLNEGLCWSLGNKFKEIDEDNSGDINLEEFLTFFLLWPKFNEEVLQKAGNNTPYTYESGLTLIQEWRLYVFNVMEFPGYNAVSKFLFCFDLLLTMVPTVELFIEGIRPSFHINWGEHFYLWGISIFFAFQYACGLLTCKSTKRFVTDFWHIIDLLSFVFWIMYNTFMRPGSLNPMVFVVFRTLRIIKLHTIFNLQTLREELEIYSHTMKLVYSTYGSVTGFMLWVIIFFSLLLYGFERGEYDQDEKIWIRDEEEGPSPFSNLYNCLWFMMVSVTTLGYGDMYPKSYLGKVVAMMAACTGIFNLTFLINIIGECFEEIFMEFMQKKSKRMDEERTAFIDKHISEASNNLKIKQSRMRNRHRVFRGDGNKNIKETDTVEFAL